MVPKIPLERLSKYLYEKTSSWGAKVRYNRGGTTEGAVRVMTEGFFFLLKSLAQCITQLVILSTGISSIFVRRQ